MLSAHKRGHRLPTAHYYNPLCRSLQWSILFSDHRPPTTVHPVYRFLQSTIVNRKSSISSLVPFNRQSQIDNRQSHRSFPSIDNRKSTIVNLIGRSLQSTIVNRKSSILFSAHRPPATGHRSPSSPSKASPRLWNNVRANYGCGKLRGLPLLEIGGCPGFRPPFRPLSPKGSSLRLSPRFFRRLLDSLLLL